ncbi:hypothetical protein PCANC_17854 [Puccinia coronata f. sp. avenae]|uniref:FAD-binding domain-containing protein n=1 Tax=Puccinia coronata f. sp. avenae TaxID=200324 RepID=A0A2N5U6S7_9BASI|nr:hypothetical protein PCANC_17767 [Puccinia coronata f. sp. avenae]PLW33449.1 hypothetical protein PCANC_17854 [Puccinia coronata f. sp. avenae]
MEVKSPVQTADVLIVGAGPAGLMASLCLHTYGLSVIHIDNRPRPTDVGRADGIQPRTLEVLRNIGPWVPPKTSSPDEPPTVKHGSEKATLGVFPHLIAQGIKVCEASFWDPTPTKPLARTSRSKTCLDFIDVRDRYTLLLHQGFIEREFLREISARAPNSQILRPYEFVRCKNTETTTANGGETSEYPVEAVIRAEDGTEKLIRSKYLLGCDGARSAVRKSLDGAIRMEGESTQLVWGVMDCWVETNFPDMRKQCLIHSRHDGSIMVIPRERDLVRFYVQLPNEDSEHAKQTATLKACQEQASKIFQPYTVNFGDTEWFSIYKIGQRLANAYTLDGRILLGGDAVHTHSPKAGQGMNISMLDMFSLAWKINLIEKGIGKRETIIETYEQERRGVAQELLTMDAEYSKHFSGQGGTINSLDKAQQATKVLGVDPQLFMQLFKKKAYFSSGCGAVYHTNVLNAAADSSMFQGLPGAWIDVPLRTGERLLPGNVVRALDGNPVEIEQAVRMDGAFRIYIFLGAVPAGNRLDHLDRDRCFLNRFRAPKRQTCSIFNSPHSAPNPFFTLLLVSSRSRDQWDVTDLPPLFSGPYSAQVYADELENTAAGFGSPETCSLHSKYGFDEDEGGGGIIIVRPDGYVGAVVSLSEPGWMAVERYFDGFLIDSAA